MTNELFDICDDQDNVIGQAPRARVHAQGLLHRAVHIWVWRSDGRMLVHLRSERKDEFPLCYTSSASGHVDAGEDYETAAHRELKEELGLNGELKFQVKLSASEETANEHTVLYFLHSDAPVNPDPEEIAAVEYFQKHELSELYGQQPARLSPPFKSLLKWWLDRQESHS